MLALGSVSNIRGLFTPLFGGSLDSESDSSAASSNVSAIQDIIVQCRCTIQVAADLVTAPTLEIEPRAR